MRTPSQKGFTLIEVVVVVAIVAIVVAIATYSIWRSQERVSVERATAQIRSALETARSMSAVAGSRIGTARMTMDGSCTFAGQNQPWIDIDVAAGTINFPANAVVDGGGADVLSLQCDTWRISDPNRSDTVHAATNAIFQAATGPTQFAFGSSGKVILPGGGSGQVWVALQSPRDAPPGLLVLASGIMCQSPVAGQCDSSVW
jgi:type II secretion system protein H